MRAAQPRWTVRHITAHLGRHHPGFTYTKTTVGRWLSQPPNSTTVNTHGGQNSKPSHLREQVITLLRGTLPLVKGVRQNRHSIAQTVAILNDDEKVNIISESTVRRIAKKAGLRFRHRWKGPQITPHNHEGREGFYDRHVGRTKAEWRLLVWTDSHALSPSFVANIHNDGVWLFDDDPPPPPLPRLRRPENTLHCYGALTKHGLLGPIFITGRISAKRYIEEVLDPLVELIKAAFGEEPFLFQQDGASPHRANTTQQWLADSGIDYIGRDYWPGNSPDLNIIEGVWPGLQAFCAQPGEYDLPHSTLKSRATLYFSRQTPTICRTFLDSAKGRMVMLRKADYWAIKK